jgi:alkanesulfonate monooxygenase SsuD/methylene tetrahydromethanopterin reductase-like flavin-dependent oxidoreductase (luciferase family)
MDVGIFLAMEPCNRPPAEDYAEFLDLAQQAEELGYRSLWMATRHFSPAYAADPSPLVLLAAAAARTRKLEFGPSVVTLPLENPLRLAEDFATLDALSNGRARLGVGSGDDAPAFRAMGVDFDERAGINSKLLPELLGVLAGQELGGVRLYPEIENPLAKAAMAAQSARGASWAASLRIGLLQGRAEPKSPDPTLSQTRAAEAYRSVLPEGRVITARNAWIGTPEDPMLIEALVRYDAYLKSRGKERLTDSKAAIRKLNIISNPDAHALARDLSARVASIKPDELLITVDPGGMEASERQKRLTLMAEAFGLRAG